MSLQPVIAPLRAAPPPPAPRIPRRIIALRLPWWPTERLVRRRPEVRTHPFVTAGESRNRLVIAAANPRAIRAGLAPGMPLADGRAIVPEVVVRPADPTGDARALERLARWADRFTPRVMPDGVDTIFLDIAGCAHLFGGEEALMASLRTALEDFGLTVRLALADTPGAAWALAHYGADDPAVVPVGTGPSGLMDALAELPVGALRLSADVAAGLESFGLDRIRTLSGIDSVKLIRRFGVGPVRRLQQALGQAEEPIIPLRPLPPRETHRAFAEPISTASDIHAAVDGLLDDLCLKLSRSGEGARRLRLVCHRADGDRHSLTIGTSRPLRRKKPLMGLFAEKLEQVEPGFGIDEITLATDVVETIEEVQEEWRAEGSRVAGSGESGGRDEDEGDKGDRVAMSAARDRSNDEAGRMATLPARYRAGDEEELADLLDRLGNRFGFARIGRPVPRQSWLPELAAHRESASKPAPAVDWPEDRRRPLRLLSRPERVEVVSLESCDPSPAARGETSHPGSGDLCHGLRGFRRQGRFHQLRMAEGPERLECEWWREDAPSRDYYLVEDEVGCRYWLFREGGGGCGALSRWFLHGVFG
ncbi:MAG: DNA polymerase Y family protein [Gemmatimonadota bacterium]|nr:DNA polymerase Y family protein [Gemmatimonadota bacterium]